MSYFIDICLICLEHSTNLIPIRSRNINGIIIEDKLKYILPKHNYNSNIPRYICVKCENNLRYDYESKQKYLQNITTYEKYAQQITTTDGSYKYLLVNIRPDFVYKETEITEGNYYDTNIFDSQTEIDIQVDSKDFVIEHEINKDLILTDELALVLHEIKKERSELDDTCNIAGNVQISNNSESFSTGNDNIIECSESLKKHHFTHINKEICETSFQNLQRHLLIHTGKKPFTCEVCNKSFRQSTTLKLHKLVHTGDKSFNCEVCNKSFRYLSNLKKHKLVHSDEKLFICEVCNKSFRQSTILKRHKLIHTGEKPFRCEICNESFRQLGHLNQHKLWHTGEKPFTCEVCHKKFRRWITLKQHKFVHTGEKPFNCEVCNKSFRQPATLKRHKLVHTGEKSFNCEVCNKSFGQLASLKRHKLVHTGEKPFSCDMCKASFTTKHNLNRHLRIHPNSKFEYAECAEKLPPKSIPKRHIFDVHRKGITN